MYNSHPNEYRKQAGQVWTNGHSEQASARRDLRCSCCYWFCFFCIILVTYFTWPSDFYSQKLEFFSLWRWEQCQKQVENIALREGTMVGDQPIYGPQIRCCCRCLLFNLLCDVTESSLYMCIHIHTYIHI